MICTDAREYLFAFLDNELDAHLSIEVQRHLEHCPGCAQQAEIEREIGKHLTTELQDDSVAPPLDEAAVERMLALRPASVITGLSVFSRRQVLQLSGLAAAVTLVL
ncbi:MAG: zf-HC2 domain-containing protein, partial [Planctomycetes bacterium]|nr:zf-HC2 domain-containing protein [Planctomycetota bacterium]